MEDKLIKFISLSTTFGFLICAIYLFAYWSSFGINILEFVGLSDFIKLGIYPVFVGFSFFVIGSVIGSSLPTKRIDENKTQEQINRDIIRDNKILSYLRLAVFLLLAGTTIFEYIKSSTGFWHSLGLTISVGLISLIGDIKYLEPIIPNRSARYAVMTIFISAFPFAFTTGKSNAQDVLSGRAAKIINTNTIKEKGSEEFTKKGLLAGQDNLKFVGAAGDYFFFITMDNSVTYAVKYSDLHFLELKSYKPE